MSRLEAVHLKGLPGVVHGFFGRDGGVSAGIYQSLNCGLGSHDKPDNVAENRRRVAEALAPGARLVTLNQIHSPVAHVVDASWGCAAHAGDGLATATPGLALAILTADCAPVLFADAAAGVIGAAHAGWKGALSGVLESTIVTMERLGAARARIAATIGPAITQANYEVGADFRMRFVAVDPANERFFVGGNAPQFHFDLGGYIAARLAVLSLGTITQLGICTYPRENGFFSFRRATHSGESDYGREVSAIMLTQT